MDSQTTPPADESTVPHPGSKQMPKWNVDELVDAPVFDRKKWFAMLGPGLLMGGAAIGGGEWLMGPTVTARYGGALMWLGTLSILGQVIYNVEISRYTLYSGEPIFTGKFRVLPGPMFWVIIYLILDFGSIFPYLAANAATPVAAIYLGAIPDSTNSAHQELLRYISYAILLLAMVPLIFGGKVYNSLKLVMTVKIFVVLGFLALLAVFYSQPGTWQEIFTGFVKFGNVPVQKAEDQNGNGILDPGEEDWDSDGHADVIEPEFFPQFYPRTDSDPARADFNNDGTPDAYITLTDMTDLQKKSDLAPVWPDLDGDTKPDATFVLPAQGEGTEAMEIAFVPGKVALIPIDTSGGKEWTSVFVDFDGDGTRDGDSVTNIFVSLWRGNGFPHVDLSMIAFLAAFAAIAGSGGLSNVPISNYTRDQGWGMGHHVGAIPSVVGGQSIQLSHVGTVFRVNDEVLPRWKRWYRHVLRDQFVVWMPACFLGIALPSMLSMEFLKRGTIANQWTSAGMTADGVLEKVSATSGTTMGNICWFMTLFCGFLVLAPSMAATMDGFVRRWVDVFWTASPAMQKVDPRKIKYLYFGVLCAFGAFGLVMLSVSRPTMLLLISTNLMNFALGFSCWHTLVLNHLLLPKQLRPGWLMSLLLFLSGLFFWALATISALKNLNYI